MSFIKSDMAEFTWKNVRFGEVALIKVETQKEKTEASLANFHGI